MEKIYLITVNYNIEFKSDYVFSGWNKEPSPLYGYKTYEGAQKEIENLRQYEKDQYKKWLKENTKYVFIHHQYSIQEIDIFTDELPY